MNKSYKVVWCHVRNTYIVASELASRKKNKGKFSGLLTQVALSVVLSVGVAGVSLASVGTDSGKGAGTSISRDNEKCQEAETNQIENIAIGCGAAANGASTLYDRESPVNKIEDVKLRNGAIAMGQDAKASSGSIVIGTATKGADSSVVVGSQARSEGISGVAVGAGALTVGNSSMAFGRQSAATGDFSQAFGNVSVATGTGSLAMGHSATAEGDRSIAIGSADIDRAGGTGNQTGTNYQPTEQTVSSGKESIAIGATAKAKGDQSLALGADSMASGQGSVAIGQYSQVTEDNVVSFGNGEYGSKDILTRKLTHVADGLISETSQDAINGSQLYTTNQKVAGIESTVTILGDEVTSNSKNIEILGDEVTVINHKTGASLKGIEDAFGAGAEFDEKGNLTMPNYKDALSADKDLNSVEEGFEYVGGKVSDIEGNITILGDNITENAKNIGIIGDQVTNITEGTAGLVKLDGNKIVIDNSITGAEIAKTFDISNKDGGLRTLDGIEKAVLDADSNQAVSGKQLHQTNQKVQDIGDTVTILGDEVTSNSKNIEILGDEVTVINNKTGASLKGIEDAFGAGAEFDDEGNLTMPNYKDALSADKDLNSVEEGFEYVGGKVQDIEGNITILGDNITENTKNIGIIGDQVTNITEGTAGLVKLDGNKIVIDNSITGAEIAKTFDISNKDGGLRTLDGIEKAVLDADSNQAVSGKQLHQTNQKVKDIGDTVTILGDEVTSNSKNIEVLGDEVTIINTKTGTSLKGIEDAFGAGAEFDEKGNLTMPNYKDALSADKDLNSVEEGFEYVGGKVSDIEGNITILGDNITENTKNIGIIGDQVTNITEGTAGLVKLDGNKIVIDNSITGAEIAKTFDISNKDGGLRTLDGVEEAVLNGASNQAVSGKQLHQTNQKVKDIGDTITILGDEVTSNSKNIEILGDEVTVINHKTGASLKGIEDAFGAGAEFDEKGNLTMPNYKDALSADKDLNSVEEGFEYVGGKVSDIEGNIKILGDNITENAKNIGIIGDQVTNITEGTAGLVKLDGEQIVIDNAIQGADLATFNFANQDGSGRTLTGIADGKVSGDSSDAINGSQLYQSQDQLAKLFDKDAGYIVDADGNIEWKNPNYAEVLTGAPQDPVTGDVYPVTTVKEGFDILDNRISNISAGKAGLITVSSDGNFIIVDNDLAPNATVFDISRTQFNDGEINPRKLTGVAKGWVDPESYDAVNGAQLHERDLAIKSVQGDIIVLGDEITLNSKNIEILGDEVTIINNKTGASLKGIEDAFGAGAKFDEEGNLTMPNYKEVLSADKDLNSVEEGFEYVGDKVSSIESTVTTLGEEVVQNSKNIEVLGNEVTVINHKTGTSLKGIEDAFGAGAKFDEEGNLTMPNYKEALSADKDLNSVEEGFEYVGGKVSDIENSITNLGDDITNITQGSAGLVKLEGEKIVIDNTIKGADLATIFDISNKEGGLRTLDGVEEAILDGVEEAILDDESNQAVSGKQLHKTNQKVAGIEGTVTVLGKEVSENSKNIEDLGDEITKQGTTLTGVAEAFGAGAEVNPITGELKSPNYSEALGLEDEDKIEDGVEAGFKHVGGKITEIEGNIQIMGDEITNNSKNIEILGDQVTNINNGTSGLIKLNGNRIVFDNSLASSSTIFDISNNNDESRTLTGVSDGKVESGSKDAVNGGQLHDTNQKVTQNSNNIGSITDALGGGAGIKEDGTVTGPTYTFQGGTNHTTVGGALEDLDGRVTNLDSKVDGIVSGTEGIVKVDGDKIVIDNELAGDAGVFDISNGDDDRTLTGVKDGEIKENSKDAINGGQIYASNDAIVKAFGEGAYIDENGYVSAGNAFDLGQEDLSIHGALQHLNNKAGENNGIFQLDREKNQIIIAANEDINKDTVVNMGDRVVTGVANGKVEKDSQDAVNGGQLWETNQKVEQNSTQIAHMQNTMNHYNTRLNSIEKTVHQNRKIASAGISSAMAMSSIPYLEYEKYSMGMGVASYDGEAAISIGATWKISEKGNLRIQGSYDSQNKAGVGIGVAFSW